MSTVSSARRATQAVRQGLSTVLGIAGLVAVIIGLLYLFAADALPHVLQVYPFGTAHARFVQGRRGLGCVIAGGAALLAAWLIRVRRRA